MKLNSSLSITYHLALDFYHCNYLLTTVNISVNFQR